MQKKSYNGIFGINKSFFFYLWRFLFISNDVLCIKRIDKFVFFIARGLRKIVADLNFWTNLYTYMFM